jgi:beta-fructofuranosidase
MIPQTCSKEAVPEIGPSLSKTPTSPDRNRPAFHITAPSGWLNDPNGIVHADGRYHVFFQHNPVAPRAANIHWGHTSSPDLVNWTSEPIALRPRPGRPDSFGCWTGVVTEVGGRHVAAYSAVEDSSGSSVILLAHADPSLTTWTQDTEPAAKMPDDPEVVAMRDPCLFRHGDRRYAVVGAGLTGNRAAILLFDCEQLDAWRYLGTLLTSDDPTAQRYAPAHIWECPQLVEFDGRWVLIVSLWHGGDADHQLPGVSYLVGDLMTTDGGLQMTVSGGGRVDTGPDFYAPQAVPIGGRILQWGWSWETRDQALVDAAGWAGTLTWPRELSLTSAGELYSRPAPELDQLVAGTLVNSPAPVVEIAADAWVAIVRPDPQPGETLRLVLNCPASAEDDAAGNEAALGVTVTAHQDGWSARWDTGPSVVQGAPDLGTGTTLQAGAPEIRIIVDGSIIEAFCGALPPKTCRAYRTAADGGWALGLEADQAVLDRTALTVSELARPTHG